MISKIDGSWKATDSIVSGTAVIVEHPVLKCRSDYPPAWRKLAKKISKLEPDRKPDGLPETMPPWDQVSLNEAIIRLLFEIDCASPETKKSIIELASPVSKSQETPFDSLLKKSKAIIVKDSSKLGLRKATIRDLSEFLNVLSTKVCVTTNGEAVLFLKLGSIPHSCAPNCMFIPREGAVGQLVAIRDISAGEEINCSHIPTNCLRSCISTRQAWLRGVAGSECRSACCNAGPDLRRRVLCIRCHPMDMRSEIDWKKAGEQCFVARNSESENWKGMRCGEILDDSAAINEAREAALVRKIHVLNEADMDLVRLAQYTKLSMAEALRWFGKNHFCYQQLQLLNCGLALHDMCTSGPSASAFIAWINMLDEIERFSVETALPFNGMDELVRIVLAPETLQMVIKLMGTEKRKDHIEESLNAFARYVDESCACLVLIEGEESVHAQDGLKLKHWFVKKLKNWISSELLLPESPSGNDKSFVSSTTASTDTCVDRISVAPRNSPVKYFVPAAIGLSVAAALVAAYSIYRKRNN